jgi:2-C-methyl-D-erythritol 4-phosphate cytidylyltransferase
MSKNPLTSAIIVAAGSSERMGFDKLFAPLGGIPVLARTISAFENCPSVEEIIIVTSRERVKDVQALAPAKKSTVIEGGAERWESVWNGLQVVGGEFEFVAIHDGARPLIRPEKIEACIAAAVDHGAAACARRITDTVKRASDAGFVTGAVDREGLWAMQTPQVFRKELILRAYAAVRSSGKTVTDEVSAVESINAPVFLVESRHPNPKITYANDLEAAERLVPF